MDYKVLTARDAADNVKQAVLSSELVQNLFAKIEECSANSGSLEYTTILKYEEIPVSLTSLLKVMKDLGYKVYLNKTNSADTTELVVSWDL